MKNLYRTLIICVAFITTINAQNPFIGTWEYQDGNEIFRVELSLNENNRIRGHYSKIQTNNGFEIVLYKSNYNLGHGLQNGPTN